MINIIITVGILIKVTTEGLRTGLGGGEVALCLKRLIMGATSNSDPMIAYKAVNKATAIAGPNEAGSSILANILTKPTNDPITPLPEMVKRSVDRTC